MPSPANGISATRISATISTHRPTAIRTPSATPATDKSAMLTAAIR
jgi:hypothetical protein